MSAGPPTADAEKGFVLRAGKRSAELRQLRRAVGRNLKLEPFDSMWCRCDELVYVSG